jgi:hypothetical protein
MPMAARREPMISARFFARKWEKRTEIIADDIVLSSRSIFINECNVKSSHQSLVDDAVGQYSMNMAVEKNRCHSNDHVNALCNPWEDPNQDQ